MPASQFFAMHREIARHKAVYWSRLADIAVIPSCDPSYYRSLKEDLKREILGWDEMPERVDEPKVEPQKPMESDKDETKGAMINLFAMARRFA